MPLRSIASDVLEDDDLKLLEEVLGTISSPNDSPEAKSFRAAQLVRLFQAGATTREDLLSRFETEI